MALKVKTITKELGAQGKSVSFYWVPAHLGIDLNERVDQEAKRSIDVGVDSQLGCPYTDFKAFWKAKMRDEFHLWCMEEGNVKGRFYFQNYYSEGTHPWFRSYAIRRKSIVSLNRLRSNHTCLKDSLVKINIVNSSICACKKEAESPNHIFWQCELYKEARDLFEKDLIKNKVFPPFSVESLLHNMEYNSVLAMARFINSININI